MCTFAPMCRDRVVYTWSPTQNKKVRGSFFYFFFLYLYLSKLKGKTFVVVVVDNCNLKVTTAAVFFA